MATFRFRSHITIATVVLGLCLTGFAKDRAPLSASLLSAKTISIENRSGYQQLLDQAYSELKKWNKYSLVQADSDLILVITAVNEPAGRGYDCRSTLEVKDRSGMTVWSNTRQCHSWKPSVTQLVQDFRKRVEQQ